LKNIAITPGLTRGLF